MLSSLCVLALVAHPLSVSSSRVVVDGAQVAVDLRCQSLTLVESLPIDTDGDRRVSRDELAASRDSIERYLLEGYRLTAEGTDGVERRLVGRLVGSTLHAGPPNVETERPSGAAGIPNPATNGASGVASDASGPEPLIDFRLEFASDDPLRALRIDQNLFRESDPLHRDHAQIVWNGGEPRARVLWVEDPSWTFRPDAEPRGVLASYVTLGVEHILTGYDHVAFVIALLVASRRLRSILGVVTAFTVAHSLTLAAASTGHVSVSADVVEPAIAASIVYVAVRNVVSKSDRAPWPEAFGFGLVHGLGFAGSIAETLAGETQKLVALFGFNVGVEAGQLAVVGTLLVVVLAARRWTSSNRSSHGSGADHAGTTGSPLVPRPARVVVSVLVAVAGAWWFVQRVALVVA